MQKIKLFDFQINHIDRYLKLNNSHVKDAVLKKYNAYDIEDLNALDYDDIVEDIQDWTCNSKKGN